MNDPIWETNAVLNMVPFFYSPCERVGYATSKFFKLHYFSFYVILGLLSVIDFFTLSFPQLIAISKFPPKLIALLKFPTLF